MAIQEQLHNIDSVRELVHEPETGSKRYYLIDGELFEMSPANRLHGRLALLIGSALMRYVEDRALGEVNVEVGYHPPGDRSTLLAPDVAYISQARLSQQPEDNFLSIMPDLAVEIVSPSNTIGQIRRKAAIYLDNGARLVWIVLPGEKGVDVCRSAAGARLDIEFIGQSGKLSGEDILPGFELEIARLFPVVEPN
jgi:Uma2 family endonuclease